jgi:hypothetical protein
MSWISDIDVVQRQTLQPVFDRAYRAVIAEVENRFERQSVNPRRKVDLGALARFQQASNLGRHHVPVTRILTQSLAQRASLNPCPYMGAVSK